MRYSESGSLIVSVSTETVTRLASLLFLLLPVKSIAQSAGDASLRIEYQYVHSENFHVADVEFDYWSTDTQVLTLSAEYAVSDKWSIFGSLPYIRKRFVDESNFGGDPHNPNDPWWVDYVPTDKTFIDDGSYHADFQDMTMGVRYRLSKGPLTVSPYIGFGFPASDYPFYAKAAVGLNLWTIPIGASFNYVPYFDDWYVSGNMAYVISEEPLDVNVDFWMASVSVGYWFKPAFSAHLFVTGKSVIDGYSFYDFVDDPNNFVYPDDFDTEEWYNHDRLFSHHNVSAGIGFDYFLSPKYKVSGSYYSTIDAEESIEIDYAVALSLTRFFSKD